MTHPTLIAQGFDALSPVRYHSTALASSVELAPEVLMQVVLDTNQFLFSLAAFFEDSRFEFYEHVGQRNLSGFVGEVFARAFDRVVDGFVSNPHADGRPDLLDLTTPEAERYFRERCFLVRPEGRGGEAARAVPLRTPLAPFKYGGLEVKASIGSSISSYKQQLRRDLGIGGFSIGLPRIDYLNSITYWAHHTSCANLVGLYYDYVPSLDNSPQVMLVMQAELTSAEHWRPLSTGESTSKKTSNTSLTADGRRRMYDNVVVVTRDRHYQERFRQVGVQIQ